MIDKYDIFNAIDGIDDDMVESAIKRDQKSAGKMSERRSRPLTTVAAASLACIVLFGASVSVAAVASPTFRDQLIAVFGVGTVREADIEKPKHDKALVDNVNIDTKKEYSIIGHRHSFLYEYNTAETSKGVIFNTNEKLYTLNDDKLKELKQKSVSGTMYGKKYSFDYHVAGEEVVVTGLGNSSVLWDVLSYTDGIYAYGEFGLEDKDGIVKKACIAKIDLTTGKTEKISGDNMICNFVESPSGQKILCNHRSKGYWSYFDLLTGKENKIKHLNGYLHTDEVKFVDDSHVMALSDSAEGVDIIDLDTDIVRESYPGFGDYGIEWNISHEGGHILIHSIVSGKNITVPVDTPANTEYHAVGLKVDDYMVIHEAESQTKEYYLVRLSTGTYKHITLPDNISDTVELKADSESRKLLIYDEKKLYVVDISEM